MARGRMTMMRRDDYDKDELLEYAYKVKENVCAIIEALEGEDMQERNRYRDDMRYQRGVRMRDEWDMEPRRGRYSD